MAVYALARMEAVLGHECSDHRPGGISVCAGRPRAVPLQSADRVDAQRGPGRAWRASCRSDP